MIRHAASVVCLIVALVTTQARAGAGATSADVRVPRLTLIDVIDRPEQSGLRKVFRRIIGINAEAWLIRPYGVAWDGEDLIVTDPGAGKVARLRSRSRTIEFGRAESTEPLGVTVCGGRVLVTDGRNGTVEILDKNLAHAGWLARDLERPTGISCSSGSVLVAETAAHRIIAFKPDGSRVSFGSRGG